MNKRRTAIAIGMGVAAIAAIGGTILYRDAHYWAYDDYRWTCRLTDEPVSYCVRGRSVGKVASDLTKIMRAINRSETAPDLLRAPPDEEPWRYRPKVKVIGVHGDTVDVEIVNALTLTQSMGTSGADEFMAEATFNLTEHAGIQFVNYLFEEGDHASPGRYSREDFLKTWKIKR